MNESYKQMLAEVRKCFAKLDKEDRASIANEYCTYCWTDDPDCLCWNDE